MTTTLRVGSVPYLVGRPLDLGLEHEPGIDLVHEVPARLVESLRAGEIDVAMVSSIELFRRPGYRYIDSLAVAGEGHVSSVQLFLRREVEQVQSIALDPASRTARTLLRVLLAEGPGETPEFLEVAAGEDPRSAPADAWLRIGDTALREHHGEDLPTFNPSQAWTERTGLPFIFAPWIVRPGVEIEPHLPAFRAARARGAAGAEALARQAAAEWELPLEACRRYLLDECIYEVDERMRQSLLAFRDRAADLGLCQGDLTPEAIPSSELYA